MLPAILRRSVSRRLVVAVVAVLMAASASVSWALFHGADIELGINAGTARRPLVAVGGKVTQIPAGDYLAANTLVDTSTCTGTNVIAWNGTSFACAAAGGGGGGITNTAPAGTVMLSNGTNAIASSLTDTGTASTAIDLLLSSVVPTALAAGQTNDWAPGNQSLIIVTPSPSNSQISSMVADANCGTPKSGSIRTVCNANISHGELLFQGADCALGTATNRFYFPTNNCNGFVLGHRQCAQFVYSCTSNIWMLVGNPGLESEIGFQMGGAGSAADVALGAAVNDYAPTGWYQYTQYRIAAAAATSISGMAALPDSGGVISKVRCFSTFSTITFLHNSGSSLAGNRLLLPGSANLVVPGFSSQCFRYDNQNLAWLPAF